MHDGKHNTDAQRRRIRSFVRREGRLTPGQQRALDELWAHYGQPVTGNLNPAAVFGRNAPLTLEIGFGDGASLATMAANEPAADFIGIEVHRPGVGHLLIRLEALELTNVRVFCNDAVEVLEQSIGDVVRVRIFRTETDADLAEHVWRGEQDVSYDP